MMSTPRRSARRSTSFFNTPLSSAKRLSSASFAKSPYTPGASSFNSLSLNSSVLGETPDHVVECFGNVVPVFVSDALVSAEPGTEISAKISSAGWAWLVCGRKLLVWQYKNGTRNRNCQELLLPPSDLAHRADLALVLLRERMAPAAIAVSPSGIVRYWPNVAHEGSSLDTVADLQGEECFSLTDAQPIGCILATTTSSLMLITPQTVDGQTILQCSALHAQQSLLLGIGRRVSSFIFGAMPAQSSETRPLVKVLAEPQEEDDEKVIYVLVRNSLQKWLLEEAGRERLCSECDLDRPMKEQFHAALWERENTLPSQLKAWCIDMQLTTDGVMVLMAALNPQVSQQLHFALGVIDTHSPTSASSNKPCNFELFSVLKFVEQYTERDEESLLSYKFVLPSVNRRSSYVYNSSRVFCIGSFDGSSDMDIIDFKHDRILGAGSYEGTPLFHSFTNGIVCVRSIHAPAHDISATPEILMQEPVAADPESETVEEKRYSKLRSAFVLFCRSELLKSEAIIDEMFPSGEGNAALDQSVATLSERLIDDIPVSDPRWSQSGHAVAPSTMSVIIHHQLEDKLQAHKLLLNFLKGVGLWGRLRTITVRGTPMATRLLLKEHAEKLVAAMQLRSLQVQHMALVDACIKRTIQDRTLMPTGKLTATDHFFQMVSGLDSIFPAFLDEEEEQLKKDCSPKEEFTLITTVNNIFVKVLQDACLFRDKERFAYEAEQETNVEYFPWTAFAADTLTKQHALTVSNAVPLADDAPSRGQVFQQLTDLADLILHGYKVRLDSLSHNSMAYEALELKYQQDRTRLIAPLVKASQYERATALAEKYYDFGSLVEICEATDNQTRLRGYMTNFAGQDFPEFVFKWYLDKGHTGKLLQQPVAYHGDLSRFLRGHDTLSWLHNIQTGDLSSAAKTLKNLGLQEERHLSKKKTLLSLSKLASLASEEPFQVRNANVENVSREHDLIMYQETLPASLLEAYCMDPDDMRVLTPEEMIQMYTSEDNVNADEYDFMKALELIDFLTADSSRMEELRLQIWCQAILRDQWEDLDTDNPIETMKSLLFYRVIELAFSQGASLQEFLPSMNDLLTAGQLETLSDNDSFKFLLRAGYEHIQRLIS
ncbi:nuclear pore complex protein Nup133-like [Ornithodoros turicata]|uniref:nuclear pore complex protein Nup133-like n=1 Tax=Ornithodoros turicata TaxID=34597 RepID=UPI0031399692